MTTVLAIETSQREGGVALRDAHGKRYAHQLTGAMRHDDEMMPSIDRLCREAGIAPSDLDVVGLSIGPGGFTGLRIAVSAAKMLAITLKVTLVAVPSALVAVMGTLDEQSEHQRVLIALASKRDSFWLTPAQRVNHEWILAPGDLVESEAVDLDGIDAVLADQYFPDAARLRCEAAGVPIIEPVFDPRACLEAVERLHARGDLSAPEHLVPLYPRQPEAVSLWDQRHDTGKPPPHE